MTIALDDKRFRKVPLDSITTPRRGARLILDCWWEVIDGHVLSFDITGRHRSLCSPQCNSRRSVVETLKHEESEVRRIPVAYWYDAR